MADYRDHFPQIQAAAATVAAVSVDPPEKSRIVANRLGLPFPVLCDRRVVQDWGIFNPKQKGGIAKPSVFLIEKTGVVAYASLDTPPQRPPQLRHRINTRTLPSFFRNADDTA